jgi:hypothetical protein
VVLVDPIGKKTGLIAGDPIFSFSPLNSKNLIEPTFAGEEINKFLEYQGGLRFLPGAGIVLFFSFMCCRL